MADSCYDSSCPHHAPSSQMLSIPSTSQFCPESVLTLCQLVPYCLPMPSHMTHTVVVPHRQQCPHPRWVRQSRQATTVQQQSCMRVSPVLFAKLAGMPPQSCCSGSKGVTSLQVGPLHTHSQHLALPQHVAAVAWFSISLLKARRRWVWPVQYSAPCHVLQQPSPVQFPALGSIHPKTLRCSVLQSLVVHPADRLNLACPTLTAATVADDTAPWQLPQ
jgi:hypothetical protein